MTDIDVASVVRAVDRTGLDYIPSEDSVWVNMPSKTYQDSQGQNQLLIALAPRNGGLLSLWLVPDMAPPEFHLGASPDPGLLNAVLDFQWKYQTARFQLGDDRRLQANIDMLVGEDGIDPAALTTSLEVLVSGIDGLIGHLRTRSAAGRDGDCPAHE